MRLYAAACFLLLQTSLNAQEFRTGYVVTHEKDTLYGELKDGLDVDLSSGVIFKAYNEEKEALLTPSDIRLFVFESGRTFRGVIPKNEDPLFAKQVESGTIDVLLLPKKGAGPPDMILINRRTKEKVHLRRPEKQRITSQEGKEYSREDKNYLEFLEYVKGNDEGLHGLRYSEKPIRKNLAAFNMKRSDTYPVSSYTEERSREYIVLGGAAIEGIASAESTRIKAGIMQTRTRGERTRIFSYFSGLFYTYQHQEREVPDLQNWNGSMEFRRQILNLIPVGVRLQTRNQTIRPYIYAGIGLAVAKNDEYLVEGSVITGTNQNYAIGPGLAGGAGVRIKTGRDYILAEVTPSFLGTFLSVGYSF